MKFNIYKSVAACSLLAMLAGCHDFEEMNTNPYQPVYDPSIIGGTADGIDIDYTVSDNALESLRATEGSAGATFSNFVYEGLYNDYQTATNLTHDIYAGYWGNNVSGFVSNSPTYSYNDGWSANRWKHFYDDRTVSEYSQLIKTFWFCDKEYYHTAFYITRIYYAFLMSAQTDTYGDIPIKYYVKGALPPEENVEYSSQEEVYGMIFDILDQAITNLHDIPSVQQFDLGEDDLCYGGDVESWIRFANTLRLRLALRVSNVDPSLAKQQGEAALADPSGLMQSQDDNMTLIPKRQYITGGNENIYALLFSWTANVVLPKEMEWAYKNQALKPGVTTDTPGFEQKAPSSLYTAGGVDETMFNASEDNCYLDPRCNILWFRPTEFDKLNQAVPEESDKDFGGVRNGETNIGGSYTTTYSPNRCNLQSDAMNPQIWWNLAREIVWFGYSESLFLRAEAALRGWVGVTETAEQYYLDGIRASMDYYGITNYSDYINNLQGLEAFRSGTKEEQLEQIITQKWIAVFPNGNEGWAEVRRTDYPRYMLVPQGGNNSNGEIPNTKLIKRVQYPDSESRNPLKPTYTQGDKVWWDVADTMDDNGKWHQPNNFR